MRIQYKVLFSILILVGMTIASTVIWSQADPEWLKSWNEALDSRPKTLSSKSRIAPENEHGIPIVINGQVFNPDGKPASGVVVHAYHRDHDGMDFGPKDNSLTTWKLQGWVKTDEVGRFEFQTIRPAPDHLGREGSHIHFTLLSEKFGRQWAPTIYFSDDQMVKADKRQRSKLAGEFGSVREVKSKNGIQYIEVKFKLKDKTDF